MLGYHRTAAVFEDDGCSWTHSRPDFDAVKFQLNQDAFRAVSSLIGLSVK